MLHIETSHFLWWVKQVPGFHMKLNAGLKWVKRMDQNRGVFRTQSNIYCPFPSQSRANGKNWVKFLFSHFFVVSQKVLWRHEKPGFYSLLTIYIDKLTPSLFRVKISLILQENMEFLFNKVAGLGFIKKRLQRRCFPVKFAKF